MAITKVKDLDKDKVQSAIDKFGVDKVNQTLTDRGIEGAKAPLKTDISTDTETKEVVDEQIMVKETPVIEEPKAPETTPGAIPGIVPEKPKIEEPKIEEPKVKVEEPKIEEPVEVVKTETETIAEQKGYTFTKDDKGAITFTPKNLDEALELFDQFGPNVNLDKSSKEFSTAQNIKQTYSKYKNAPESVYLEGFKTNEIGVGGETWDMLVRQNGGEPSVAMLAAQKQYDDSLKLDNVKNTTAVIDGTTIETQEKVNTTKIQELDTAFTTSMGKLFGDIANEWDSYKRGTERVSTLNQSLNDTSSKIDTLNLEKRKIMDDVEKQYPGLSLSQQLTIADERMSAVDDQLFVLQRQYNSDFSTYKFETEKAKGDFEFNQKNIKSKMDVLTDMYNVQRGDIIRQETIERQDTLLEAQIKRSEEARKQAIIDGDSAAAKKHTYDLELAKEKAKIAKEAKAFGFLTPEKGVIAVTNPLTGEVTFRKSTPEEEVATGVTISEGTTQNRPDRNKNPGNLKMGDVGFGVDDQGHTIFGDAKSGYTALVNDLTAKKEGRTRTGLTGESTLADLGKVYAEDPKWANGVSRLSGISLDTQLKDIDMNQLAPHVAIQEGFSGEVTATTPVADGETTLTQEALVFNIGKSIFGSKISDAEGAKVQSFVDKGVAEGKSTDEIIDEILFFKPTDNKDLGNKFKDVLVANNINLNDFDMRRLGNLLSDNKISTAVTKVEDGVLKTARTEDPEGFVSERLTKTMTRRADELLDKVAALENTEEGKNLPIGTFEGTVEEWIGRFKSPEATQLKNDATRLVSDFRLKNLGSAVTETEETFLDGVLPKLLDSTANFNIKVQSFKDQSLGELNDFRGTLELPTVDANSLFNKDLRGQSYLGETTTTPTETKKISLRDRGRTRGATTGPSSNLKFNLNK